MQVFYYSGRISVGQFFSCEKIDMGRMPYVRISITLRGLMRRITS